MTPSQLDHFNARLDAITKSGALIKWIAGAIAAVAVWGTTIQIQTAKNTSDITEIREDRRVRIKDADAWRREVDLANVRRDKISEDLVEIIKTQSPRGGRR